MDDMAVRERVTRVEAALEALEGLPAGPRRTALDAVGALVELYGEGWARALRRLEGEGARSALAEDELVAHLLLVHGLHPENAESRVRHALDDLLETVNAEGLTLAKLEVSRDSVHVLLEGPTPGQGFRELVREALRVAAPELDRVEVEAPGEPGGASAGPALVQLQLERPGTKNGGSAPQDSP